MKRAARIAAIVVGTGLGLVALALGGFLVFANTGAGRGAIEALAAKVSGGKLRLQGLSGRFPDALRAATVQIRDARGTWLTLNNVVLDWSPWHLFAGALVIDKLTAAHAILARWPAGGGSGAGLPPVRLAVDELRVDRLDLAPGIAGAPATLRMTGKLSLASPANAQIALDIERLDRAGSYIFRGALTAKGDQAKIDIAEPPEGLVARLAGLPDLGPLSVTASLAGPRAAERLSLVAKAGALHAESQGMVDLDAHRLDLEATISSAAMKPRPDLSWRSANVDLHLHGALDRLGGTGTIKISDLAFAGARVGQVTGALQGNRGKLDLSASFNRIRVPGRRPDLLAAAPLTLHAEVALGVPGQPMTFTLTHPLLRISGQGHLRPAPAVQIAVTLPNLEPFAALVGAKVEGRASFTANLLRRNGGARIALAGVLAATGGDALASKLLGPKTRFDFAGLLQGKNLTVEKAVIDGAALHASAHGGVTGGVVDLAWGATLANIAALAPTIAGPFSVEGRVQGPESDLALTLRGHGLIAVRGAAPAPIDASAEITGLPKLASGRIAIGGRLAGAPLAFAANFQRKANGATRLAIDRAAWKSLSAQGSLTVPPGSVFPLGQLRLRAARLADLDPLIGTAVTGSIEARLDTVRSGGALQARLHADARKLSGLGGRAQQAVLDATIDNATRRPTAKMRLAVTGIAAKNLTGNATLDATGPESALALHLVANLTTPGGGGARIQGDAVARLSQRALRLTTLQARYRGQAVRLLAPAQLRFANGITIDRLQLGAGNATLTLAGRLTPTLRLTASLSNASPMLAVPFLNGLGGTGSIAVDAALGGTLSAPNGTIRATIHRLRLGGIGNALPAADLDATATIRGRNARLEAHLAAGANMRLQMAGVIPLRAGAPIDLKLAGKLDLALLDPLLTPSGRRVHGTVTLALGVAGTMTRPRITGSARIGDASLEDYTQGVHITAINGTVLGEGDTLRLGPLTGRAGNGTITLAGTIAIFTPGVPIDLTIRSHNARPLASDLLTATLDADLTLKGALANPGSLVLAGRIVVSRASIQIPDQFPHSVAVIEVRRPGQKPAPPPAPTAIGLDLTIDAPAQVFVRGHGLDAEMGGELRLKGKSSAPQITGGFTLRRGTFSLAGRTLNFTTGRVAFDGFGVKPKIDPTLDFVAESTANGVTARLSVTGYADAPKIGLSSAPVLPQDEILARLLFGESMTQVTPFQAIEIAQAVASISGIGVATDPLAAVRNSLGLDRLTVGAASGNTPGAALQAGKYIANRVYLGTKETTSGAAQAQVQIDLTKHLKLKSTLGTGQAPATGVTPGNDPGSSIGLSYQFEY